MLANVLSTYWWATLLRGLVAILFGITLYAMPGISLVSLTLAFGVFSFVDGVGNVVSAFGGRREAENWWVLLLSGLAGIAVGVLTVISPGTTALGLLYYIALWAVVTGILTMVAAIHLRKEITGEFWLLLAGLAATAFGVFLVARPGEGALAVLSLIATYSILLGVMLVVFAFKARSFANRVGGAVKNAAAAVGR